MNGLLYLPSLSSWAFLTYPIAVSPHFLACSFGKFLACSSAIVFACSAALAAIALAVVHSLPNEPQPRPHPPPLDGEFVVDTGAAVAAAAGTEVRCGRGGGVFGPDEPRAEWMLVRGSVV